MKHYRSLQLVDFYHSNIVRARRVYYTQKTTVARFTAVFGVGAPSAKPTTKLVTKFIPFLFQDEGD